MNFLDIQNLEPNSIHIFRALVVDVNLCTTNGTQVPRVTLSDPSKRVITFRCWGKTLEEVQSIYKVDKIYDFEILFKTAPSTGVIYINKIISATMLDDTPELIRQFKPDRLKHLKPENRQLFESAYQSIQNKNVQRLIELCYGLGKVPNKVSHDVYRNRYTEALNSLASVRFHDSYPGGYINHLCGMLRIAMNIKDTYTAVGHATIPGRVEIGNNIDWDLVFAGIYLHDIGKIGLYVPAGVSNKYRDGHILDHKIVGVGKLYQAYSELDSDMDYGYFQQICAITARHGQVSRMFDDQTISDNERLVTLIDSMDALMVANLRLE